MFNGKVGSLILVLLIFGAFMTGCFWGKGDNSPATPAPAVINEPLTSVRFEIALPAENASLRAAAGDVPQVFFELRLLDRSSSSSPVVMLRKQALVSAGDGGFVASVRFENVAVLPAIASMSINGGYLVGADSKQYRIWVGRKDLVAASENVITLVGKGDKSPVDVAVNLLDRLIADPANVANLALPIFEKVDAIVAGLNLNSTTVYDDAYTAYNGAYGVITVPADAEFTPPSGYASLAFPKKDSSVQLVMPSFTAASAAWMILVNRSASSLTPSWSVAKSVSPSLRLSAMPVSEVAESSGSLTPQQRFDLLLRRKFEPSGSMAKLSSLRQSLRPAVSEGSTESFYHVTNSAPETFGTINATCRRVSVHANGRATYFFLDNLDAGMANINIVVDLVRDKWEKSGGIYEKNRQIFGVEPDGVFTSSDVTPVDTTASATYILISRQIFTAGYFYSRDLFPEPNFNQKKIIFLQLPAKTSTSNEYLLAVDMLASTAAHELQHMIHYWQKRSLTAEQYNANAWLDEAMSGYAEHVNGFSIADQNNQPKASQVKQYLELVQSIKTNTWYSSGYSDLTAYAYYGKAYLFGVWLAQNYGTAGVVTGLLNNNQVGDNAIDYFNGSETPSQTYAKFLLALIVNNSDGGFYGFKGLSLNQIYAFRYNLASVTLSGPYSQTVDVSAAGGLGQPVLSQFAAAYVKIINGNGGNVTFNATLPAGVSLFHLQK